MLVERKYLVLVDSLPPMPAGIYSREGLLSRHHLVRVRATDEGASLRIAGDEAGARPLYEYPIPRADALELLPRCWGVVERKRYELPHEGKLWKVDRFFGRLEGLWIARVEIALPGESVSRPSWVGQEITSDARYATGNLLAWDKLLSGL